MILARRSALTAGVISDSKATVETMKEFEVNRIVHGESFAVEFCARNGLDSTKKAANAGDFKLLLHGNVQLPAKCAEYFPRARNVDIGSEIRFQQWRASYIISDPIAINSPLKD